jgi:CTP:molybdopterin cytidylyltransferase MocA
MSGPSHGPIRGPAHPRIAGAVLAAGAGTRMGRPKADLVAGGTRLLDRAIAAARNGGCAPVIAVVRAGMTADGAVVVVNAQPERGLRSSLDLAVAAAAQQGVDALVVLLVDAPGVGADAVRVVVSAWSPDRVVRARYGDRPGHPIAMSLEAWRAALAVADLDGGARRFLAAHPDLVDDVPAPGDPSDIDTPEDLLRWSADHDV